MTLNETQQIVFIKEPVAEDDYLLIEKDDEANVDEDGNIKTSFLPGSKAYARVFGNNYTVASSAGTVHKEKTNSKTSVVDTLKFSNTKTATLSHLPDGSVSCEWIGDNCGRVTITGLTVTISKECLGILTCEYSTEYDQWSVSWGEEGAVIVLASREVENSDDLTASVEFEFADPEADLDISLSLVLDSEENNDKSTFDFGETAYFLCYHTNDTARSYTCSDGSINREASNLSVDVKDEEVSFQNSKTAKLKYLPIASVTRSWIGKGGGSPIFNGRTITFVEEALGILICSYETAADRVGLSNVNTAGTILVSVTQTVDSKDYSDTSQAVFEDSGDEDTAKEPVPYDLNVKDYCEDTNVVGVEIILDGVSLGNTDSSGSKYLGLLVPGSTHSLKMVKTGYIDSDVDKLANDAFTIPKNIAAEN